MITSLRMRALPFAGRTIIIRKRAFVIFISAFLRRRITASGREAMRWSVKDAIQGRSLWALLKRPALRLWAFLEISALVLPQRIVTDGISLQNVRNE